MVGEGRRHSRRRGYGRDLVSDMGPRLKEWRTRAAKGRTVELDGTDPPRCKWARGGSGECGVMASVGWR